MMPLDKKLSMVGNNQNRITKIKLAIQHAEKALEIHEAALACEEHNMRTDMKYAKTSEEVKEVHERYMHRKNIAETSIKEKSARLSRLKGLLSSALRHEKAIYAL